jgi:choline dehydrogenase-like flavoprotein
VDGNVDEDLRDLGIEVVADLPGVGANVHDHSKSQVVYTATRPVRSGLYARKPHVLLRGEPSTHRTSRLAALEEWQQGVVVPPRDTGALPAVIAGSGICIMPLMALGPPITLPRGHGRSALSVPGCETVW